MKFDGALIIGWDRWALGWTIVHELVKEESNLEVRVVETNPLIKRLGFILIGKSLSNVQPKKKKKSILEWVKLVLFASINWFNDPVFYFCLFEENSIWTSSCPVESYFNV